MTILKHGVIDCGALFPNSYTSAILEKIADLAAGDARIAIQALRSAANVAEKSNRSKISEEDIERAYEEVKDIKRKYYLERLTSHHKLIVELVQTKQGISSSSFYKAYKQEARKHALIPKSSRTFNNYVQDLIELGYLKTERAGLRGNVRVFSTV